MKSKPNFFFKGSNLKYTAFFLGLISSLGYAPFHFFPITIFSYLFLIYLFTKKVNHGSKVFLVSFSYALGSHLGLLYWIAISFVTANSGGYVAGGFAVLILASFLSIFTALAFHLLFKYFENYKKISFGLSFVFLFSLFDWLKGNILWGFPWTPISSLWVFDSNVLYPFSIVGVWGYCLVTYSLIISIFYFFFDVKKAVIFALPFFLVFVILPKLLMTEEKVVDSLQIRLIQPNIKQEDKWEKTKFQKNYIKITDLINSNKYKGLDLIVLPETVISFDITELLKEPHRNNFRIEDIKNVILGAVRIENKNSQINLYNSMYLIKKNKLFFHDKAKLVPFGEYIPFKKKLGLRKLSAGSTDFSVGQEINILKLSDKINILPLICYEVIFPKMSKLTRGKYNLIVNITNDAWYRKSSGPHQHFAHSRIRAVMEGVSLIRVANTGISSIIDAKGNILKKIDLGSEGIIDYKLPIKETKTLYSVYGESIFYLIMLTLLFLICIPFFYVKLKKKFYYE